MTAGDILNDNGCAFWQLPSNLKVLLLSTVFFFSANMFFTFYNNDLRCHFNSMKFLHSFVLIRTVTQHFKCVQRTDLLFHMISIIWLCASFLNTLENGTFSKRLV